MITPARPSDYRLLHRFAFDDDHQAFEELVRRHSGMARAVCRRVLGPAGDADDAAQAAFLSLAQHARPLALQLGSSGSLAGWLYRVAVNAALQQRRSAKARRRREELVVREREPVAPPTGAIEHSELLNLLDEELKALPSRYRTPLVLCHLEGKTQHEAAEELGLSYGTLRRRLDRGRKLLKMRMSRRGVLASSAALALVWKQSAAEAASTSTEFVSAVGSVIKGRVPTVAVVRPRVAAPARVPRMTPTIPSAVPATAYTLMLATVLTLMMIPPVVSLLTTAIEIGVPAGGNGPTLPLSPGGSLSRSAV